MIRFGQVFFLQHSHNRSGDPAPPFKVLWPISRFSVRHIIWHLLRIPPTKEIWRSTCWFCSARFSRCDDLKVFVGFLSGNMAVRFACNKTKNLSPIHIASAQFPVIEYNLDGNANELVTVTFHCANRSFAGKKYRDTSNLSDGNFSGF